jgi:sugar phosphate isomerase/epimerase
MQLSKAEIARIRELEAEYGLNVSSLGSPIGKVKLLDVEDGTKNRFVPFKKYLQDEVKKACELAHAFETKLIRGFSFYHPKGSDPREHLPQAIEQLGQIAEVCHKSDLLFGLEVEANLVGQTGDLLAEIHDKVDHPAMVLIFDAANIATQGFSPTETFEQYEKMKKGLGWMHIKDYRHPQRMQRTTHVDEEALKHFVPADSGDGGHEMILRDFREMWRPIRRLQRPRWNGRRAPQPLPTARLQQNRLPPPRLRRRQSLSRPRRPVARDQTCRASLDPIARPRARSLVPTLRVGTQAPTLCVECLCNGSVTTDDAERPTLALRRGAS